MSDIKYIRVESGPLQFGTDWCGTFIRGDSSYFYAFLLRNLLETTEETDENFLGLVQLRGLLSLLEQCLGNPEDAQKLKEGLDCFEDPEREQEQRDKVREAVMAELMKARIKREEE